MSSLKSSGKLSLERLLGMESGYVLDFSNRTFAEFFEDYGIDIYSEKYSQQGQSKANRLRAFWSLESNDLVGRVLLGLCEHYTVHYAPGRENGDDRLLERTHALAIRLVGGVGETRVSDVGTFLQAEFPRPDISRLPIDGVLRPIVALRLTEIEACFAAGAHLATIILCGSVLEAVLMAALRLPTAGGTTATAALAGRQGVLIGRKGKKGGVSLGPMIDTAHERGLLGDDILKYSHALREFRNYVHASKQLETGFTPDVHTATLSRQAMLAALDRLAAKAQ